VMCLRQVGGSRWAGLPWRGAPSVMGMVVVLLVCVMCEGFGVSERVDVFVVGVCHVLCLFI